MPFIDVADMKVGEPLSGWKGRFWRSKHSVRALTDGQAMVANWPIRSDFRIDRHERETSR